MTQTTETTGTFKGLNFYPRIGRLDNFAMVAAFKMIIVFAPLMTLLALTS